MDQTVAILSVCAALLVAGCTFAGFWMAISGRITKAQSAAENALQEAVEAKHELERVERKAEDAHTQNRIMGEALGLHREYVARDYVHKDAMQQMEDRIVGAFREAARVSTEAINQVAKRLDTIVDRAGK